TRFAVGKALGHPSWSKTSTGTELRPNQTFAKVVKRAWLGHADFRVFTQTRSQPRGPAFGPAHSNEIDLEIVRGHLLISLEQDAACSLGNGPRRITLIFERRDGRRGD